MKKILVIAAIALSLIIVASPVASATSRGSTDFLYQPLHYALQVTSDTNIPNAIPYCAVASGTIPFICYSPSFIRSAYNFPSTFDGTGQTIVIVDAFGSPTIQNDLAFFDQRFNIPAPPSFTIFCGNSVTPLDPSTCPVFDPTDFFHGEIGWAFETSLDVQYAHAMAPGANIVLDVATTSSGNAINDAEASAIAAFPGSIMSQSFGIPEFVVHNNNAQLAQANKNYLAAQAALITVFASAGDSGASNGGPIANALFPASNPLNTAVGGTQGNPYVPIGTSQTCAAGSTCSAGLTLVNGPCSTGRAFAVPPCTPAGYGGEQVWNEPAFSAATGGAPSLFFPTPSYQNGLGLSSRNTADVSYNAAVNGGVLVRTTFLGFGAFFIIGGTSAGSPQWAAIAALANQAAGRSLGFLNNAIYKIAAGPNYSKDFHDIRVGNNALAGTTIGFNAVMGWDQGTGVGTPNVTNLIPDLVLNA